jgi:hypothetical protein
MSISIIHSYMSMKHTSGTYETYLWNMWNMYIWNIALKHLKYCLEIYATYPCYSVFQCVYAWSSCLIMQVSVEGASFMCLTSLSIYIDHWKSFMKIGIKKSHEMISHVFVSMALLSAWIALLSEWKHKSSMKPCNLAQMTLDELYSKSHGRFILSKCPENAPMDHKG